VPQTVDTCRCGGDLTALVPDSTPGVPSIPGRSLRTLLWLALVVVAAGGGIAFGI